MSEKKEVNKWEEARKTGILAFVLSLPILIWRSVKAGSAFHWVIFSIFVFWFAGRASDIVFTKFINRWEIRRESDQTLADIEKFKTNLAELNHFVSHANSMLKKRLDGKADEILAGTKEKIDGIEARLNDVDRASGIIRDSERQSVKDRIIELREKVLVAKKDINSSEIRKEFEKILEHTKLLSEEESDRFTKDLKDMGFYIKKNEGVTRMYRGGRMYGVAASYDAAIPISASSMDRTFVGYSNGSEDQS